MILFSNFCCTHSWKTRASSCGRSYIILNISCTPPLKSESFCGLPFMPRLNPTLSDWIGRKDHAVKQTAPIRRTPESKNTHWSVHWKIHSTTIQSRQTLEQTDGIYARLKRIFKKIICTVQQSNPISSELIQQAKYVRFQSAERPAGKQKSTASLLSELFAGSRM